ncbi:hypothetical protein AAFP30_18450 [Gordonia sp. CPCC 205515]
MTSLRDPVSVSTNTRAEGAYSRLASEWTAVAYLRPRRPYLST